MPALQRYELDQRALDYIVGTLTDEHTLSVAVRRLITTVPGQLFTLAPPGLDLTTHRFQWGGLLAENIERASESYRATHGPLVPIESLTDDEALLLHAELQRIPGSVCILDDITPHWSELEDPGPLAFGIGQEVYHLARANMGAETLAELLSLGEAFWHRLAVVCAQGLKLPATAEQLLACVDSATLITCTAFDAEGFVAWQRLA